MQDLFQRTIQSSKTDVTQQLGALQEMSSKQLKAKWCRFYRSEPPVKMRRDLMIRAVAYKIQERAFCGLKGPVKLVTFSGMKTGTPSRRN